MAQRAWRIMLVAVGLAVGALAFSRGAMPAASQALPPGGAVREDYGEAEALVRQAVLDLAERTGVGWRRVEVDSVRAALLDEPALADPRTRGPWLQGFVIDLTVGKEHHRYYGHGARVVYVPDGEDAEVSSVLHVMQIALDEGKLPIPLGSPASSAGDEVYLDLILMASTGLLGGTPVPEGLVDKEGAWRVRLPLDAPASADRRLVLDVTVQVRHVDEGAAGWGSDDTDDAWRKVAGAEGWHPPTGGDPMDATYDRYLGNAVGDAASGRWPQGHHAQGVGTPGLVP